MKKLLIFPLLYIIVSCTPSASYFQAKKNRDHTLSKRDQRSKIQANKIKENTLLVVLQKENSKKNIIYNEFIKKAIEKEWSFSEKIEYVTLQEYKKIKKSKKERNQYTYLIYDNLNDWMFDKNANLVGNVKSNPINRRNPTNQNNSINRSNSPVNLSISYKYLHIGLFNEIESTSAVDLKFNKKSTLDDYNKAISALNKKLTHYYTL